VTLTVRVLPPPARSPWTAWRREVKRVRGGAISRGASRRWWARDLGMGIRFHKAGGSTLREREAEVLLF
jgi:hypothetical protein